MTAATMNYVVKPLNGFWKGFMAWSEIVGYSRAAAHLSYMGYHDEAKECMMQVAKLKR